MDLIFHIDGTNLISSLVSLFSLESDDMTPRRGLASW